LGGKHLLDVGDSLERGFYFEFYNKTGAFYYIIYVIKWFENQQQQKTALAFFSSFLAELVPSTTVCRNSQIAYIKHLYQLLYVWLLKMLWKNC